MQVTKRLDLALLGRELASAGVVVPGLSLTGTETDGLLLTYDGVGELAELPPEAVPVVEAHTAPPPVVDYLRTDQTSARLRTTDAAFTELARIVTTPQTVYRATVSIIAIDANDGTTKDSEARLVFKRLAASLAQVGTTVALGTAADAAASSWAIAALPDGTDLRIGVRGAAGKTIDWIAALRLDVFAPEGL
jgi:hypothetical protein